MLRTFKKRQQWFENKMRNDRKHGDLARCAKDSALISIRLLCGAMALRALPIPNNPAEFSVYDHREKRVQDEKNRRKDDIWINDLGGDLPESDDLTDHEKTLLVRVLRRADKELAHLTETFDDDFNTARCIIGAIDLVERLLGTHLYAKLQRPMPPQDCGISWHPSFFAGAPQQKQLFRWRRSVQGRVVRNVGITSHDFIYNMRTQLSK